MTFAGESLTCVRGERLVFEDVSFEIGPGGALLLMGPNGCGKSSLLRLVAGFLRPAGGRLLWQGGPVADDLDAHRARLHYVGHLDAIKPVFTVAENLGFWAAQRVGRADAASGVARALDRFGIADLADIPARLLSAGQKRRLNLARIVATKAPLWLLDEPTTALDEAASTTVRDLVAEHCAGGGIAMLATHIDIGLPDARVLRFRTGAPTPAEEEPA